MKANIVNATQEKVFDVILLPLGRALKQKATNDMFHLARMGTYERANDLVRSPLWRINERMRDESKKS